MANQHRMRRSPIRNHTETTQRSKMPHARKPEPNDGPVSELVKDLHIEVYDALLIGDGSGCGWEIGCGWACVLIDRLHKARKLFSGGMNTGTVTIGELMPYLHALTWYTQHAGKDLRKRLNRAVQIHIITDSQAIATQGNLIRRPNGLDAIKSNRPLWAAMAQLSRDGFECHFHWVARSRIGLNVLVDYVAGAQRRSAQAVQMPAYDDGRLVSIYDVNPVPADADATAPASPKPRSRPRPKVQRPHGTHRKTDPAGD